MSRPRAYSPEPGYRYQILCRNRDGERAWEHCDYAVDRAERSQLLAEHRVAYGTGYKFKTALVK